MSSPPVPTIAPHGPTDGRPRWSVVIPTHQCASYLGPCLESVLGQLGDPGFAPDRVEIVVVDDCSDDDPEAVVDAIGRGRVRFVRNEHNLGAIGNFNACLAAATGELVHLLHGDDLSAPGFYATASRVLDDHAEVATFVARTTYIDEHGHAAETTRSERTGSGIWHDALEVLAVSNRVRPPGVAVRRAALEVVGGFRTDLPHAADWEMWARLAAHGPVWFEDRSLARYRRHSASDTAGRVLSGDNIVERLRCIDLIADHLAPEQRAPLVRRARAYSALFAARTALGLVRNRHLRGAANQARVGIRSLAAAARTGS
jgi:glycosyltransferase involved in cell wall biosynthesis